MSEYHNEFEFEAGSFVRATRNIVPSLPTEITRSGSTLLIVDSPHEYDHIFGI